VKQNSPNSFCVPL